jgi:hypothetical protein
MNIPFGIKFKCGKGKHSDYTYSEVSAFIEGADNVAPQSLRDEYVAFLKEWLANKVKPSTLVNVEVLKVFQSDLDNRCQIDFREGHDHDDYVIAGGEYFGRVAQKLSAHIQKNSDG